MISRAITTLGLWTIIASIGSFLVASTNYTTMVPVEMQNLPGFDASSINGYPIYETIVNVMPDMWILSVGVLMLILILAGLLSTIAIWRQTFNAPRETLGVPTRIHAEVQSAKQKRDQQARLKRLLENMDDTEVADALAALESDRLTDDGERMTVGELLTPRK
ncbi:MAG: hypothetical protein SGI73_03060 [Chloroflexota bacterium]|nr:hypothetical protein [Chloroflexota bacterium]